MKTSDTFKPKNRLIPFSGLSIQQRLPLLICILLLCVVLALGWLCEIGVRRAAMEMGRERLVTLTRQLSSMFGQAARVAVTATITAAHDENVAMYVSGGSKNDSVVLQNLHKLRPDSTWVLVELLDAGKHVLLRSSAPGEKALPLNSPEILAGAMISPDSGQTGKLQQVEAGVYYPVIASISENKKMVGYIVRWRRQAATARVLEQFSQLLGTNAALYFGNADGSLWTDLMKVVAAPPITIATGNQFYDYRRLGTSVIATATPVPNTNWTLLIEFSQQVILETSTRFITWVIMIGAAMVIAGSALAWLMSRNITRPLHQLTAAAVAMAAGDYAVAADVNRKDEIGKLARAFHALGDQVKHAQDGLERKVEERTRQLHAVNRELEAFSYSVSHDLRAPLRSISGYATILKEEYATVMDPEANRLTGKIVSNARKMGQLIDDLISFSKMAGKELRQQPVNMQALANACMAEVLQPELENRYRVTIQPLPVCEGDEALLRQVWINLISNAIKYSAKNATPSIEIGFQNGQAIPAYYIRDNGAGFDMKYVHKLFGVFQRLHSPQEFEGLGIGLALVRRIINRHNGDIWAQSATGEGAVFYFSLPKTNGHEL